MLPFHFPLRVKTRVCGIRLGDGDWMVDAGVHDADIAWEAVCRTVGNDRLRPIAAVHFIGHPIAMWTLVFLAFAMLFGGMAAREVSRGYVYDRGGSRISREKSPAVFWIFVGLEFFGCAVSAATAISVALK